MTVEAHDQPTRWDLSNVYSGLEGDDYAAAFAELEQQLSDLQAFCDDRQIRRLNDSPPKRSIRRKR